MLHALSSSPNFSHIPQKFHQDSKEKQILDYEPAEVVDIALQALQRAGVELIEWRALLYRRMTVPLIVKDFSYLVPDDDLEAASDILSSIGLPLSPPSKFLLRCEGDFQAKGRFHRITRYTSPASVQHLTLYPMSFSSLSRSEVVEGPPFHIIPSSRCPTILVPRPPAVYASIIRTMLKYPSRCSTRTILESDLEELVGYNLLGLQCGYVDTHDDVLWEQLQIDQRINDAVSIVRQWGWDGEWREGEEWIGDALVAIVDGSGDIDYLPSKT